MKDPGVRWDIGPYSQSGEPHYQDHEQHLLHDDPPKESASKAEADANQAGVTERAPEMPGD
jgi:hypothetical protein